MRPLIPAHPFLEYHEVFQEVIGGEVGSYYEVVRTAKTYLDFKQDLSQDLSQEATRLLGARSQDYRAMTGK